LDASTAHRIDEVTLLADELGIDATSGSWSRMLGIIGVLLLRSAWDTYEEKAIDDSGFVIKSLIASLAFQWKIICQQSMKCKMIFAFRFFKALLFIQAWGLCTFLCSSVRFLSVSICHTTITLIKKSFCCFIHCRL
jgi:hypothetical protein